MDKEILKSNFFTLISDLEIKCKVCEHEPVLDFEKAAEIDARFGLVGKETKSLFIKGKCGKYYIYMTTEDRRMDSKKIKQLVNEKVSVVNSEDMKNILGCEPGCIPPFGYGVDLIDTIIVDKSIKSYDRVICSCGIPEMTIEMDTKDLDNILKNSYTNVIEYDEDIFENI